MEEKPDTAGDKWGTAPDVHNKKSPSFSSQYHLCAGVVYGAHTVLVKKKSFLP